MNVVLIIHAREAVTARVFEAIRKAQPERLFVVADGPRTREEELLCARTRRITEDVDWPCEQHRNYAEKNLGCRQRVITGLDWVFSIVDKAIIIEDDCLPDQAFFSYAEELLERYKDDLRVGYISGTNFIGAEPSAKDDYWLSTYGSVWGWATWRRAWQLFDQNMSDWPESGSRWSHQYFSDPRVAAFWEDIFQRAHDQKDSAWGYNWLYCLQRHSCFVIAPRKNLILNIGFQNDATHTSRKPSYYKKARLESMPFPLQHPATLKVNEYFDRAIERKFVLGALRQRAAASLLNKHYYGDLLRRVPILGNMWTCFRDRKKKRHL